jgi:hypothetical protein
VSPLAAGGIRGSVVMVRQEPPVSVATSSSNPFPSTTQPQGAREVLAPPIAFEEVSLLGTWSNWVNCHQHQKIDALSAPLSFSGGDWHKQLSKDFLPRSGHGKQHPQCCCTVESFCHMGTPVLQVSPHPCPMWFCTSTIPCGPLLQPCSAGQGYDALLRKRSRCRNCGETQGPGSDDGC